MARLQCSSILVTIILYVLVIKVNSKRILDLLPWGENHFIKELVKEDIPEYCQKIGICSNITSYDTVFVNKLLRRLKKIKNFYADQLQVPYKIDLDKADEICPVNVEFIYPQAAIDQDGQWQYILNTEAHKFQCFQTHTCIERGSSCSKRITSDGFNSSCYQEITLMTMAYLDVKNKTLAVNYFQVPSCCSCRLIKEI